MGRNPDTAESAAAPIPESGLWQALDLMTCGLALFDGRDRFVMCNAQYRRFFPAIADRMVPGVTFEQLVRAAAEQGAIDSSEGSAQAWMARRLARHREPNGIFDQVLSGRRHVRVEELRLHDGGRMLVVTDVTLLKEQEQTLAHRIGELEDIHNRLEAQGRELGALAESLARARDEAERANRTKSEFLANMSHELRSPLNAVIGFAEIMKDELFGAMSNPQYRDYAQDIWSSGTHLLSLINDILDLSKVEAGKLELQEQKVDIRQVVETCLRLMATRAQKSEVLIGAAVAPDMPLLWADERKAKQIVLNLLSNSVKFTRPGGRISIGAKVDADGAALIWVADTGIGITAADIPKALALFGQVDSSLSRKYEGTGLGLPLTRSLVELHGGTLTLTSEVGVGTTATVRLPPLRVLGESTLYKVASRSM